MWSKVPNVKLVCKLNNQKHLGMDERGFTLLELIYSNLCEINGILSKGDISI